MEHKIPGVMFGGFSKKHQFGQEKIKFKWIQVEKLTALPQKSILKEAMNSLKLFCPIL